MSALKTAVFDIESDGLLDEATTIHCLVYRDLSTKEVVSLTSPEDMVRFFQEYTTVIGHNIIMYDLPLVEKLLGIKYEGRTIDTLVLSWYINPSWRTHGLASIGEMYGIPKPPIDDWENLTVEEYVHRCTEDVEINYVYWRDLWSVLISLYETPKSANRLINYLTFKMDCARRQSQHGWKLNENLVDTWISRLSEQIEHSLEVLTSSMPPKPVWKRANPPAKMFKRNGDISVAGQKWKDICEKEGKPSDGEGFDYISEHEAPNPNSPQQVKEWFFSLGWEPDEFNYIRADDGSFRKVPQVYIKDSGGQLSGSVIKLSKNHKEIEEFVGLSVAKHRLSILEGFKEAVDSRGYLKAEIGGLTNTLRFKHRAPLVNLPGVGREYGEVIRGALTCEEGEVLCGSDMSSLEDRTKQHYIYPFDPDYVSQMLSDDFDPHLDLALEAGAVTEGEVKAYKEGSLSDEEVQRIKDIRHNYKQGNYACVYGAGEDKLSLTLGISKEEARNIIEAYWRKNRAVRECTEDLPVKRCNGADWLFNPVSKFWYSLRSEKDKFSTLNQSTGVFCFDTWVRCLRTESNGEYDTIIGQFHDEVIGRYPKEKQEDVRKFYKECIKKANEILRLNRELDVDVQFGKDYSEIH